MRVCADHSRTSLRLVLTFVIVLSTFVGSSPPALGQACSGSGQIDDRGGEVVAECDENSPGSSSGVTVHGLWSVYCADVVGVYQGGDTVERRLTGNLTSADIADLGLDMAGEYRWLHVECWRDGMSAYVYDYAVDAPAGVSAENVRDEVAARLEPPSPEPRTSPPLSQKAFVHVRTWLWLDAAVWSPIEVSESRGLTTVTVWATPTHARWVMGDGGGVTCLGPGVVWTSGLSEDASDCSYTYEHSSYGEPEGRFEASVTVTWEFEWWINDVYQGVFGTVDLAAAFGVAVGEIQAVETGG
ncbi:MAG: hypothetical protein P1T08_18000 [Acidimicrobiia bacterium]|nr:hypothetical protein [Acidimicrobiia bacterium]